jgi:hypothetical protein
MHDLALAFVTYVQQVHAHHNHVTDWRQLAAILGVLVKPGPFNSCLPGEPTIITLMPDSYTGRWSYKPMHELAHFLLRQSGIEAELIRQAGDLNAALPAIEALCHHAAGLLQMPAPLLAEATARHGQSGAAILHLQQGSRASLASAMRRWAHAEPDAHRGAFLTVGHYVTDAVSHNYRLPFWRLDRVPEVALRHPEVALVSLGKRQALGVVAW